MTRRRRPLADWCVYGVDLRCAQHGGYDHLAGCREVAPWIQAWAQAQVNRHAGDTRSRAAVQEITALEQMFPPRRAPERAGGR
jgi:hypothetical protein